MNDNELMNRRRFFKKTAKEILPMLGTFVAAPTVIMSTLTSCGPDGCDGCEAACQDDCEGACTNACEQNCSYSCKETCEGGCSSTCEGTASGKPTTGTIDGHEYVDLGLSVLWAKYNIGSSSTNDVGKRFPYVFPDENDDDAWLRRLEELNLGKGTSISGTDLDTAKNKWGRKWRMPENSEFEELLKACNREEIRGVGVKFTSKLNGESIFFPFIKGYGFDDGTQGFGTVWAGDYYGVGYSYIYAYGLEIECYTHNGKHSLYIWSSTVEIYPPEYGLPGEGRKIACYPIRPVAERNEGNVSSCNGTCTANCSSDCTGTCKTTCNTECKGACKSCTASCKDDCTAGCGANCTGGCSSSCTGGCKTTCTKTCADTCASDCTSGCSTGCSSTCKGTCSGGCSSGCSGGCKGACSGSCGSGCSGGCSSCTATCADSCKAQTSQGCEGCSNTCKTGCGRQCHWSCGGSCDKQCEGACITGCQGYNRGSCSGCFGSCSSQCSSSCRTFCYSSCTSMGVSGT